MANIYLKLSNINLTPEEKQACDDSWKSKNNANHVPPLKKNENKSGKPDREKPESKVRNSEHTICKSFSLFHCVLFLSPLHMYSIFISIENKMYRYIT